MAAINEKRVNWRKVAEERGEENNALRARVMGLEAWICDAQPFIKSGLRDPQVTTQEYARHLHTRHKILFPQVAPIQEVPGERNPLWESFAQWDRSQVLIGNTLNESTDRHPTKEHAEGVVALLKREGFGGEGRFFPLATCVREITQA